MSDTLERRISIDDNGNEINHLISNQTEKLEGSVLYNKHRQLLNYLHNVYVSKNKDYGNSFSEMFEELGIASAQVRLSDKYKRFMKLASNNHQNVKDESLVDTLLDMANYALMTVIELEHANPSGLSNKIKQIERENDCGCGNCCNTPCTCEPCTCDDNCGCNINK